MIRIFLTVLFFSTMVWAQEDPELERLSGYQEYRQDQRNFDKLREEARVAHDEQMEQFQRQNLQALKEYRKERGQEIPSEKTKGHREWVEEKEQDIENQWRLEKSYARSKKQMIARSKRLNRNLVSEEEELGLQVKLNRADIKKRVLYGGVPDFKALRDSSKGGGSSGKSSGGGSFGAAPSNDGFSFPSPPPPPPPMMGSNGFDDPGMDPGNFIPPAPVEPFDPNDIPPPPPLPMDDSFLPPPDVGDF